MNEQLSTLRLVASNKSKIASFPAAKMTKTIQTRSIAVTGGKGGVGKSNFAANIAVSLAAQNKKVTLLDADFGLANVDLLFGRNPKFHLGHVLAGKLNLDDILVDLPCGVQLLPGGSGLEELANFSDAAHKRLLAELATFEGATDFMIIDTAAGIASNVTGILSAASEIVVVTTPEPTAVVDAYATIKTINKHAAGKLVSLVVNNAANFADAEQVFRQLSLTTDRFLKQRLDLLGIIPHDPLLSEAVCNRVPVVEYAANSPASRALRLIAKQLNAQHVEQPASAAAPLKPFWHALAQVEV